MFIQFVMYVGGGTDTYSCLDFTVCHMTILHDHFSTASIFSGTADFGGPSRSVSGCKARPYD